MLYQRVKVVRDVNTVYNRAIPEWEIPVLTFIFDEGNVQPTGSFEVVDREYPSAGVEYDRLTRRYGSDAKSGVPYVTAVFGVGAAGIRALQGLIDEAESAEKERIASGDMPKRQFAPVPKHLAERDDLLA